MRQSPLVVLLLLIAFDFVICGGAPVVDDESKNPLLQAALARNDVSAAEALIQGGAQIDHIYQVNTIDTTPLLYSIIQDGMREMTEMLLLKGANPDLQADLTVHEATPLMVALQRKSVPDIELLLGFGAKRVLNPLLVAALTGHTEIVRIFLSHNNDLAHRPEPLLNALQFHHIETAKVFIVEYGADINQRFLLPTFSGKNLHALHLLINQLISEPRLVSMDTVLLSIYSLLDISGHSGVAQIEVNAQDDHGRSPLFQAVHFPDSLELVKLLVENGGADVNQVDYRGKSPLMIAVASGFVDIATYLLAQGADLTQKTSYHGLTSLMVAAQQYSTKMIRMLVQHARSRGIAAQILNDVNLQAGNTALHEAVIFPIAEDDPNQLMEETTAIFLINQPEMDVDILNEDGVSAITLAALRGDLVVVKALLARGALFYTEHHDARSPFWYACESDTSDSVLVMMALVDAYTAKGISPSHYVNFRDLEEDLDCLALAIIGEDFIKFKFLVETLGADISGTYTIADVEMEQVSLLEFARRHDHIGEIAPWLSRFMVSRIVEPNSTKTGEMDAEEDTCSICLDEIDETTGERHFHCSHRLHNHCFETFRSHFDRGNYDTSWRLSKCPQCRSASRIES